MEPPPLFDPDQFPYLYELAFKLSAVPGGKARWDGIRKALPMERWEVYRAIADLAAVIGWLQRRGASLPSSEAALVFEQSLRKAWGQTLAAKRTKPFGVV